MGRDGTGRERNRAKIDGKEREGNGLNKTEPENTKTKEDEAGLNGTRRFEEDNKQP